jgi:hypothetical protein
LANIMDFFRTPTGARVLAEALERDKTRGDAVTALAALEKRALAEAPKLSAREAEALAQFRRAESELKAANDQLRVVRGEVQSARYALDAERNPLERTIRDSTPPAVAEFKAWLFDTGERVRRTPIDVSFPALVGAARVDDHGTPAKLAAIRAIESKVDALVRSGLDEAAIRRQLELWRTEVKRLVAAGPAPAAST